MWWNPQTDDHVPAGGIGESGLGTLVHRRLKVFEEFVEKLQIRVDTHCNKNTSPNKIVPRLFNHLSFFLSRLKTLEMTFRQLRQTITEFQRIYLELVGALNWAEIYQPRFNDTSDFSGEVGPMMGAMLTSVQDAEHFFRIGLPFWLVHPFKRLPVTRVDAVVDVRRPEDTLCFTDATPRFPEIFTGESHDVRRFEAMANNTSRFLRYDNPFAITSAPDFADTANSQAGPSRTPRSPIVSKVQPCMLLYCFFVKLCTERLETLLDTKTARPAAAEKQGAQAHNSDKFVEPTHHLMPPTTTAWALALSSIDRGSPPSQSDSRYALPLPNLFIGVVSDEKRQQYIFTWLKFRARMLNLYMGSGQAVAMTSQEWRTFLVHETIELTGDKSINKRARNTGVGERVRTLVATLQSGFSRSSVGMLTTGTAAGSKRSIRLSWNRQPLASDTMPSDAICQEILWELYEFNFRFELTELDLRANPVRQVRQEPGESQERTIRYEAEDRAERLGACFKGGVGAMFAPSPSASASAGLAARTLEGRAPYILALRNVMVLWRGGQDVLGSENVHNGKQYDKYDTKALQEMEAQATRFYCQSFFNFFGRAPLLPHRVDVVTSPVAASKKTL